MQDPSGYQPGDKVRVRSGPNSGERGILRGDHHGLLKVELSSGEAVFVSPEELTNFSLAARRAWDVMPKRSGRPQSATPRKKMVSMRLDVEVWKDLGRAAEFGLIPSREQAVNIWLRERLDELFAGWSTKNETTQQSENSNVDKSRGDRAPTAERRL